MVRRGGFLWGLKLVSDLPYDRLSVYIGRRSFLV
jgi:hypothetical protein